MIFLIFILCLSACTSMTDEALTVDCTSNCEQSALSTVQEITPQDTLNINQNSTPEQTPSNTDPDPMPNMVAVDNTATRTLSAKPVTTDTDGDPLPDTADVDDVAAYTPSETSDATDVDGDPMPDLADDNDIAEYTPPETPTTATSPTVENPTVAASDYEQTPCAEYYAWDYAYGDSADDIDPEFVEVTDVSDCFLETDSDRDGLSRQIDPDDTEPTEWYEIKSWVTDPNYARAYNSDIVIHYRYIPTPLVYTSHAFTGSETETYGITDWSMASDTRTSCGGVYSERGICIVWSSQTHHIDISNQESTIQNYYQSTKKAIKTPLIIRQPILGN